MDTNEKGEKMSPIQVEELYKQKYPNKRRGSVDLAIFNIIFTECERKVLDIGCGFGELLSALKAFNFETTGIVLTEYETQACLKKGLNVIKGDAGKELPFENKEFETVLLIDSIEHIKEYEDTLKETLRVLKDGGKVLIYTPNREVFRKYNQYKEVDKVHIKEFTKQELKLLLTKTGFKNIRFINKKLYYPKYFFLRFLNEFMARKEEIYLCVIAEKRGKHQKRLGKNE